MSTYKNVGGEKAYIGDISHGLARVIFCRFFKDWKDAVGKIKKSHFALQYVECDWVGDYWKRDAQGKRALSPLYGVKIIGVPADAALNLPDWKDPL